HGIGAAAPAATGRAPGRRHGPGRRRGGSPLSPGFVGGPALPHPCAAKRLADFYTRKMKPLSALLFPFFLFGLSFFPVRQAEAPGRAPCDPNAQPFAGYTFLVPEIINKNAAYAPYFVQWEDYYQRYYFNRDIQKEENVLEWKERFCDQADPKD